MALTAAVFGSSGLVGHALMAQLESDGAFEKIYGYARNAPLDPGPKSEFRPFDTADFELERSIDIVFCALGTTIKKAGSQAAFEEVDLWAVVRIAQQAKEHNIKKMVVVSSLGANPHSRNFYLHTKGQMEEAVKASGPPNLLFIRPSLLLGTREERRWGEDISKLITKIMAPLMKGPLLKYRPIEAAKVARKMIEGALNPSPGVRILENSDLHSMA